MRSTRERLVGIGVSVLGFVMAVLALVVDGSAELPLFMAAALVGALATFDASLSRRARSFLPWLLLSLAVLARAIPSVVLSVAEFGTGATERWELLSALGAGALVAAAFVTASRTRTLQRAVFFGLVGVAAAAAAPALVGPPSVGFRADGLGRVVVAGVWAAVAVVLAGTLLLVWSTVRIEAALLFAAAGAGLTAVLLAAAAGGRGADVGWWALSWAAFGAGAQLASPARLRASRAVGLGWIAAGIASAAMLATAVWALVVGEWLAAAVALLAGCGLAGLAVSWRREQRSIEASDDALRGDDPGDDIGNLFAEELEAQSSSPDLADLAAPPDPADLAASVSAPGDGSVEWFEGSDWAEGDDMTISVPGWESSEPGRPVAAYPPVAPAPESSAPLDTPAPVPPAVIEPPVAASPIVEAGLAPSPPAEPALPDPPAPEPSTAPPLAEPAAPEPHLTGAPAVPEPGPYPAAATLVAAEPVDPVTEPTPGVAVDRARVDPPDAAVPPADELAGSSALGTTPDPEQTLARLLDGLDRRHFDPTTGLLSGTGLEIVLRRELTGGRRAGEVAMLLIAIRNADDVETEHGRFVADEVFRRLGSRLGEALPDGAAARFARNAFAVVLSDQLPPAAAVIERCTNALVALLADVQTTAGTIRIDVVAGMAQCYAGEEIDGLVSRANEGLERASASAEPTLVAMP